MRYPTTLFILLLVLATAAVLQPVCSNKFVAFDDDHYVLNNPHLTAPSVREELKWAATTRYAANWHPLTWMSLYLDYRLYGLVPFGYHCTNLLLHLATTALLFGWLIRATMRPGPSAMVAALFAIHPLHVESVAWVAERKDVLSAFFFLLTLWAYVGFIHTRRPSAYTRLLILFSLGLTAKPMLVTLPVLLLFLDFWPLQRKKRFDAIGTTPQSSYSWTSLLGRTPLGDKVPLLMLAIASGLMTLWAQRSGGAVASLQRLSVGVRLGNAGLAYWRYLGKMLWPQSLAVFYPFPEPEGFVVLALISTLALAIVTVCAVRLRHRHPYFFVGWLWYLLTLLPVIGVVQVGSQSMADRYTYLPAIGIFIAVSWAGAELSALQSRLKPWIACGVALALVGVALAARKQVYFWRDTPTLWSHALDVTQNNDVAHNGFGVWLHEQHQDDQAMRHFNEAIRVNPRSAEAHNNRGTILADHGNFPDALAEFSRALALHSGDLRARLNLAQSQIKLGQLDRAVENLNVLLAEGAPLGQVHALLGQALTRQGHLREGEQHFRKALEQQPADADTLTNLAVNLRKQGRIQEAMSQDRAALGIDANHGEALNNLAILVLDNGDSSEALALLRRAVQAHPNDAESYHNLAQLLWVQGSRQEAIAAYRRAAELAPATALFHYNLAYGLQAIGQPQAAVQEYRAALHLDPAWPEKARRSAWHLATTSQLSAQNNTQALRLAIQANQATENRLPLYLDTLAAAQAQGGLLDDAAATAHRAAELADAVGETSLAKRIREHENSYRARKPWRESP